MKYLTLLLSFLLSLVALPEPMSAQESDFVSEIFLDENPLKMELVFDQRRFLRKKNKNEYQPASLTFFAPDSQKYKQQIRLRARGKFRRRHCSFPPIKLNFKPQEEGDSSLQALDKVKLVTHCQNSDTYASYLQREYLVYKLYQLFTPLSFRVRKVNIHYVDSKGQKKDREEVGFLIEDVDNMAARNGFMELEAKRVSQYQLDTLALLRVAIFQYMVGNHDWLVPALHNVKLVRSKSPFQPTPVPVPYDFDYSGLVDAFYAVPHPDYQISTVRDRVYRGVCHSRELVEQVLGEFVEKKQAIMQAVEEADLSSADKEDCQQYLQEFFDEIADPKRVKRVFIEGCEKKG
jgi:hypothetical protein